MAKLIDSVKALGEKITGEKINGDTLFDAVKDAGEKMTGKEIEGKELNDLIAETAKEYQGGGGTVVVDELPETGEANTIYELHEQVEPAYNWVAMITYQMQNDNVDANNVFIFDTYEQMVNKINSLRTRTMQISNFGCYVRNEDKLYFYEMGEAEGTWNVQECKKVSNYKFEVFTGNFVCVLRSYEGLDESDNKYYGTLYDGTKIELVCHSETSSGTMGFILHQATFEIMEAFTAGASIIPVTVLPTAEEAVANYLDDLIAGNGQLNIDLGGQIKNNSSNTHIYHWNENNFYEYAESDPEPVYTGPLEWYDFDEPIYLEMPYQKLLDGAVYDWLFQPEQGGEKVSYWVYTSNKWVNMNDIGGPSPIIKEGTKIIFNLQSFALNLNQTTVTKFAFAPYNEITMWDRPSGGYISCGHYFDFSNWDYNKRIGIDLEVNGAQNQIIAYLSASESNYWRFNQPVVIYEGDVSGLTDTSTILDHLPSELTFVLSEDDFVSSMGGYIDLFNTPTTVVYNNDRGEEISVKVEY